MSIKFLLKAAITFTLLGIIVWIMGGLEKVLSILAGMKFSYVLFVLFFNTADRTLMTYKWLRLLNSKKIHIPLIQGMRVYCASMIWGMLMPSTIGADAIRIIRISRKGHDAKEITASVVIERFAGFLTAILLGIASFFIISHLTDLTSQFKAVFWFGCITLIFGAVGFVMSFSQKTFDLLHNKIFLRFKAAAIIQKLRKFHTSYKEYQYYKKEMFIFFSLTFGEQLIPIIMTWLIAKGLGVEVSLLFLAGALPLAMIVSRLPISINGLGVFEATFALLLSFVEVSTSQAVAIAFSARMLQTVAYLPWWAADVISSGRLKPPNLVKVKTT